MLDPAPDHQHRSRGAARAAGLPERGEGIEPERIKIITKISFPSVLPDMLTGVPLAVGTAWLKALNACSTAKPWLIFHVPVRRMQRN